MMMAPIGDQRDPLARTVSLLSPQNRGHTDRTENARCQSYNLRIAQFHVQTSTSFDGSNSVAGARLVLVFAKEWGFHNLTEMQVAVKLELR